MVEEAAANAEADAARKASVEARNNANSMIHDTKKNLDEFKEQIEDEAGDELRKKIADFEEFMSTEEADSDEIRERAGGRRNRSRSSSRPTRRRPRRTAATATTRRAA